LSVSNRRPDPILVMQAYQHELARGKYGAMTRTSARYGRSRQWTRDQLTAARRLQAQAAQARELRQLHNQTAQRRQDTAESGNLSISRTVVRHNADVPGRLALVLATVTTACVTVAAIRVPGLLTCLPAVLGMWSETVRYLRSTRCPAATATAGRTVNARSAKRSARCLGASH
jgi:hypothetical protein